MVELLGQSSLALSYAFADPRLDGMLLRPACHTRSAAAESRNGEPGEMRHILETPVLRTELRQERSSQNRLSWFGLRGGDDEIIHLGVYR